MTLHELQDSLKYYVIDADYCIANHMDFNEVLLSLKKEISSISIDIFTTQNLIDDISTINKLKYNN